MSLCGIGAHQPTKPPEMQTVTVEIVDDKCSSYNTGESKQEGAMEWQTDNASDGWMERLDDINSYITTLDDTQNAILNKLASLEKLVTCVQEDMTWVRGEVGVMHEVLENVAEYVGNLSNTVVHPMFGGEDKED